MPDRDAEGHFLPGHNLPGPGRPSSYDPSMNEQAFKLALLGLTDVEMARFFGVDPATFDRWKAEFPAFCGSVNAGKVEADAEVALSLYKRATGEHTVTERILTRADGTQEEVRTKTYVPGDPSAAKLWLVNRQRDKWRDRQTVEHANDPDHPLIREPHEYSDAELLSLAATGSPGAPSQKAGARKPH